MNITNSTWVGFNWYLFNDNDLINMHSKEYLWKYILLVQKI